MIGEVAGKEEHMFCLAKRSCLNQDAFIILYISPSY